MQYDDVIRRHPARAPGCSGPVLRCAFTGYRVQKLPFSGEDDPVCEDFKGRLYAAIEALIWQGYTHFLSGGALGMDMYAAEAVLQLRGKYPWIGLEMVIPFDRQDELWPLPLRRRYARLLAEADILTHTGRRYTHVCMLMRNRYLVDNADLLLAAYDGKPGGTAITVAYAEKTGVPVMTILPAVGEAEAARA